VVRKKTSLIMKRYGLIGFPLGHSFSRGYFQEKFTRLGLTESHKYDLFEIEYLKDFPALWERYPDLVGVNVTVPHKENIRRLLQLWKHRHRPKSMLSHRSRYPENN